MTDIPPRPAAGAAPAAATAPDATPVVLGMDLGDRRSEVCVLERSRAVQFQIDRGKVDVTSSSPDLGEAHETLPVEHSGEAMQICFNAQYVLDFLSAVATDVVSLELKDEVSQAVMKPVGAEGYDYTYVIMPMRV